jgi:small nuclear ribonucleoprotein (snRNP)-like protein
MSEMTTQILEESLSKIVLVRLKGGKSLRGRLKGYDQHLNLVLEETEEGDIYSQSVAITSTLQNVSYRKLNLFCWVE